MAKYAYPAVITVGYKDDDGTYHDDGVFYVNFPDIDGCYTDGETLEEALVNAADVLNLMMYEVEHPDKKYPMRNRVDPPTPINDVKKESASDIVTLVSADTDAYAEIIERENNPIAYARKKAKLNIKQLAELLGAPYRTVQDWNAGKRMPPKWAEKLVIEKIESVTV